MTFRLGCAIWAYKGWVGELFPSGSRPTDFLRLYGQRFTAVEGNTTFYSIPTAETLKRWAAETPTGFKFCPKLPRALTHQGQLTPAISETLSFLANMQTLGDRLGVVFAQLPPSYSPEQFEDLAAFLQAIPPDVALALEVRHLDWFSPAQADRLNALLTQYGVGRVLLDTRPLYNCLDNCPDDPQITSERRKPKLPLQPVITAPFTLVRYISHPDPQYNQPYLQNWATQVQTWLQQNQQVYFFVHCPIEQHSPATARHFQHLLEQVAEQDPSKQAIPPLPWERLEADALTMTQLDLF